MTKEIARIYRHELATIAPAEITAPIIGDVTEQRPQFAACEGSVHERRPGDEYHPDVLGEWLVNPYESSVHDRVIHEYLCPRCYDELCADI